jgi:hypothetical protein
MSPSFRGRGTVTVRPDTVSRVEIASVFAPSCCSRVTVKGASRADFPRIAQIYHECREATTNHLPAAHRQRGTSRFGCCGLRTLVVQSVSFSNCFVGQLPSRGFFGCRHQKSLGHSCPLSRVHCTRLFHPDEGAVTALGTIIRLSGMRIPGRHLRARPVREFGGISIFLR